MSHTDSAYFVGERSIPDFADIIFSLHNISDHEKIRFRDGFLYKYLENKDLQELVNGGYVHIQGGKILGVFDSRDRQKIEGNEPFRVVEINNNYTIN